MSETVPPLRVRKQRLTRDAITQAALELFNRHGYDQVTVAAIAEAAGVGRRTFFRYFADKEDVLFGDEADATAVLDSAVDAADRGLPPLAVVRQAGIALARWLSHWAPHLRTRNQIIASSWRLQARSAAKYQAYADHLERRLTDDLGMPRPRARLAALVGVACVQSAYERWSEDPHGDPVAMVDAAFADLLAETAQAFGPPER